MVREINRLSARRLQSLRTKMEKPQIADRPSIGGMLRGLSELEEMSEGLRAAATAYARCTLTREAGMPARTEV